MKNKKITLPVSELVSVLTHQHEELEGIRRGCMLMEEQGVESQGTEFINDIAIAMQEEIEDLIKGLNAYEPDKEDREAHIIGLDPQDPINRMAEETQAELQRMADEAQEKMERAGVWEPE